MGELCMYKFHKNKTEIYEDNFQPFKNLTSLDFTITCLRFNTEILKGVR